MCTNGRYTGRGIKARHGYASQTYRIRPEYLVLVDPALGILGVLLEPATVVAKAWDMVLQNSVLFGSVNANRRHYELGAKALAQADPRWLAGLITRQVPIGRWADAYARRPDDILTILDFTGGPQ